MCTYVSKGMNKYTSGMLDISHYDELYVEVDFFTRNIVYNKL